MNRDRWIVVIVVLYGLFLVQSLAPEANCSRSRESAAAPTEDPVDFLFAPESLWKRLALEAELDRTALVGR